MHFHDKKFFFIEYLLKYALKIQITTKLFEYISYKLFNSRNYYLTFMSNMSKKSLYQEISSYLDMQFLKKIIKESKINKNTIKGQQTNKINEQTLSTASKIKQLILRRIYILEELNIDNKVKLNYSSKLNNQDNYYDLDKHQQNNLDNLNDLNDLDVKNYLSNYISGSKTNNAYHNIKRYEQNLLLKKIYNYSKTNTVSHFFTINKANFNTVTCIWKAANDKSIDINFYTKRAALCVIYGLSIKKYLECSNYNELSNYISILVDKYVNTIKKVKSFVS